MEVFYALYKQFHSFIQKFFRRGLKEHQTYVCRASRMCTINPRMRNNCRYCRYRKCLRVGMSREGES